MGGKSLKAWIFDYWETGDFSPVLKEFEQVSREKSRAYKLLRLKVSSLRNKPLSALIEPQILKDLGDGLWQLEVAAGGTIYHFLGSVELSFGTERFVALSGYNRKDTRKLRASREEEARVRLDLHRQRYQIIQIAIYYGLPPQQ